MTELLMDRWIVMYADNVRVMNITLLVLVLAAMTANIWLRRDKVTRRARRIFMWVYLLIINFAYATADNLQDSVRLHPPVFIGSFLLAGLFLATMWHPPGDDAIPPHDNAVGTRFLMWLDRQVVQRKQKRGGG